jgi:hypothetical protein
MQAPPALPITKKKNPDSSTEDSIPQMGSSPKKAKLRPGSTIPTESSNSMAGFADQVESIADKGFSAGQALIAFAVLIFLATLVIVGWICWRKWDDIILQI